MLLPAPNGKANFYTFRAVVKDCLVQAFGLCPKVRFRMEAEVNCPAAVFLRQLPGKGIVPIQHSHPVGRKALYQLSFGLSDFLLATQKLKVGNADVGDDVQLGLGNGAQIIYLAQTPHPHLQHCIFVLALQREERSKAGPVRCCSCRKLPKPLPLGAGWMLESP